MSAAQPKESPDGRWLLFSLAHHGNFPIYQPTCDLYVIDLKSGARRPLTAVNSRWSDSWHSWSSNGRWIAFASKREGGVLARIYFSYFDRNGQAHKPFVMPQEDPSFYESYYPDLQRPRAHHRAGTGESFPIGPRHRGEGRSACTVACQEVNGAALPGAAQRRWSGSPALPCPAESLRAPGRDRSRRITRRDASTAGAGRRRPWCPAPSCSGERADPTADDADALGAEESPLQVDVAAVAPECPAGSDHAVAGDGRILAAPHDVPDGSRSSRASCHPGHVAIRCDSPGRDAADDGENRRTERPHARERGLGLSTPGSRHGPACYLSAPADRLRRQQRFVEHPSIRRRQRDAQEEGECRGDVDWIGGFQEASLLDPLAQQEDRHAAVVPVG